MTLFLINTVIRHSTDLHRSWKKAVASAYHPWFSFNKLHTGLLFCRAGSGWRAAANKTHPQEVSFRPKPQFKSQSTISQKSEVVYQPQQNKTHAGVVVLFNKNKKEHFRWQTRSGWQWGREVAREAPRPLSASQLPVAKRPPPPDPGTCYSV